MKFYYYLALAAAITTAACSGDENPNQNNTNGYAVTGVRIDKVTATLDPGANLLITAIVEPTHASNKTVAWTSSDTTVAKMLV